MAKRYRNVLEVKLETKGKIPEIKQLMEKGHMLTEALRMAGVSYGNYFKHTSAEEKAEIRRSWKFFEL